MGSTASSREAAVGGESAGGGHVEEEMVAHSRASLVKRMRTGAHGGGGEVRVGGHSLWGGVPAAPRGGGFQPLWGGRGRGEAK